MRLTIRNSDGSVSQPTNVTIESVFERLAEYEDTEEQGLLVRFLCKPGDTVYLIDGDNDNEIVELIVVEFRYGLFNRFICCAKYLDKSGHVDLFDYEFGKTVFLSREEAEAALRELRE